VHQLPSSTQTARSTPDFRTRDCPFPADARNLGPVTAAERTALTYRLERWRAVTHGILETAGSTFLLLIALRWFQAGATAKALIAGGTSFGLLLSPLVVTWVARSGLPPNLAASRLLWGGAAAFLATALFPVLPCFIIGGLAGMAALASAIPLLTAIYQENYPADQRGRLFSRTVMIRILTAALFAKLGGYLLDGHLERFRWLLLAFAAAAATAACLVRRCPASVIADNGGTHPLRALRFFREDAVFRQTLIAWMLMGFANLMMLPLRVEYLGSDRYPLRLAPAEIALYTGVIPNVARLVMSPVWGWLFDRVNFFVLRIVLNLGFMIGILSFFTTGSTFGLVAGSLVFGISNAGGDVAWSLWVTKFSPPDRVADYMSVHTFFTGIRGVLAPIAAFQLLGVLSLPTLGWISAAMIGIACLVLLPESNRGHRGKPSAAVTEDISE
jgi:MFS family permease